MKLISCQSKGNLFVYIWRLSSVCYSVEVKAFAAWSGRLLNYSNVKTTSKASALDFVSEQFKTYGGR